MRRHYWGQIMDDDRTRMTYFRWVAIIGSVTALVLVVTVGGTRCAIPVAETLGDRCGNPISNWLYDFQSLVAGTLAIFAAYMTVEQMRRGELEQGKRHREMIEINSRRDWIRIRRAFYPQVEELRQSIEILQPLPFFMGLPFEDDRRKKVISTPSIYWDAVDTIASVVEREQLLDIKELFDAEVLRDFQMTVTNLRFITNFVRMWREADNHYIYGNEEPWRYELYWDDNVYEFRQAINELIPTVSGIIKGLVEMNDRIR